MWAREVENGLSWSENPSSPATAGGYKSMTPRTPDSITNESPEQMSTRQMVLFTEENSHKR